MICTINLELLILPFWITLINVTIARRTICPMISWSMVQAGDVSLVLCSSDSGRSLCRIGMWYLERGSVFFITYQMSHL